MNLLIKLNSGSVIAWACMAASGLGQLVSPDDLTHNSSSHGNFSTWQDNKPNIT